MCDFALAVNRRWKDADGADREEVLFIDCAAFGKTGQTIGESLTKGRPIHIEGRLKFEQWEQEDGQRRSKIRVVVEQFRFVDRKPGSEPASRTQRTRQARSNGRAPTGRPQPRRACGRGSGDSDLARLRPDVFDSIQLTKKESVSYESQFFPIS